MPRYDYRCEICGAELEIAHRMSETVTHEAHKNPGSGEACDGSLERLIANVGLAKSIGSTVSDGQLQRSGFTKYVRGAKGYEKAFGPPGSPNFVQRE
jgi:putative FmdB family regulatory protein